MLRLRTKLLRLRVSSSKYTQVNSQPNKYKESRDMHNQYIDCHYSVRKVKISNDKMSDMVIKENMPMLKCSVMKVLSIYKDSIERI